MSVRHAQESQTQAAETAMTTDAQATGPMTWTARAITSPSRRRVGLAGLSMMAILAFSGCSTVEDTWDSVFGDDGSSAPSSVAANASNTANAQTASAAPEEGGLRAAGQRPDYADGGSRREPTTRFALDETQSQPQDTAVAAVTQPVAQPPAAQPAVAPTQVAANTAPQPTPVAPQPMYDPVAADPDATVIIGGGGVTVDPSVMVAYTPLPNGTGVQSLNTYNPAGASVSTLVATIQFTNGSASLSGRDRQILQQVVTLQRQYGGALRVVGHASSRTPDMSWDQHDRVNQSISEARAQSVSKALISLGAPRTSVYAGAVADNQPLYEEVMPSGEAGNRRAEIYLDY